MEKLKELMAKGKKRGILTYGEIMDSLQNLELTPEQIDDVYETLTSMGIEIQADDPVELAKLKEETDSDADAEVENINIDEAVAAENEVEIDLSVPKGSGSTIRCACI